jgi:hypothetical protein
MSSFPPSASPPPQNPPPPRNPPPRTPPPAQDWAPPPVDTPPTRPTPRFPDEGTWPPAGYRSADTRSKVATALNALAGLSALFSAIAIALVFPLLDKADRFQLTNAEWDGWLEQFELADGLDTWATFIAIVSIMVWLSRSVDNTPSLGGGVAKRGPRWAIGAWFIPIVNIVVPALILRDLSRRMSPDGRGRDKLILAWWLLYWGPALIGLYGAFLPLGGTDTLREGYALMVGAQLVQALGYVVTIVVIRRLQQDADYWHHRLRQEWQARAGAAPTSTIPTASSFRQRR